MPLTDGPIVNVDGQSMVALKTVESKRRHKKKQTDRNKRGIELPLQH